MRHTKFIGLLAATLLVQSCGNISLFETSFERNGDSVFDRFNNSDIKSNKINSENWTLVWSDEFNGSQLDREKWIPETSCWGGGNNEKQCYTDRPDNIRLEDGVLKLIAKAETFTGLEMPQDWKDRGAEITQPYSSGKVRTKGLASWQYGRFEASIKLPKGQGTWMAFWMMPEIDTYGTWPLSGEIDIVESVNLGAVCDDCEGNEDENRSIAALHFGNSWPHNQFKSTRPSIAGLTNKFNRFAVEWEQDEIKWFVNEELVFSITAKEWFTAAVDKSENPYAPFDHPFYIMFNLAVGGHLSDSQNEKQFNPNSFPNELLVDWVRVYQRDLD